MFIWNFAIGTLLDGLMDWVYSKIVESLGELFARIGNMGAELFDMPWVKAVTQLFSNLAWTLYAVGIAVACFECAIEYQKGTANVKTVFINILKGFMAASLFSIVPMELYKLCISLQSSFTSEITRLTAPTQQFSSIGEAAVNALPKASELNLNPILTILILVFMGYAVCKVFFANLKRGGIMLILTALGSLYMFSIPRGYIDGFTVWCKQIIGICFTAFLQAVVLTAGLMIFRENVLLGIGVMLASGEIPRIAGAFGLDTNTRASLNGAIHTVQSAINFTRTIASIAAK